MKIRMAASAIALFMLSGIAFGLSTNPMPRVTRTTLNGVWVCYSANGSVRLEVNPDDTGFLAFESIMSRAQSFKLVLADVQNGRFNFKAEAVRANGNVSVTVDAAVNSVRITITNVNLATQEYWLENESDATAQMTRFKAAADSMRSGK